MNGPVPLSAPDAADDQSLADQAYARIEEGIATLQLKPGQIVSENGLAKLLGLGRTPVREALQQLAREGLVIIMPKLGIMVSEIDVRKQLGCWRCAAKSSGCWSALQRRMPMLPSARSSPCWLSIWQRQGERVMATLSCRLTGHSIACCWTVQTTNTRPRR